MHIIRAITLIGLATSASPALANVDIALTPDPLDFGAVEVSTTSPAQDATITALWDGNGTLNGAANNGSITSVTTSNPVFTAAQDCVGFPITAANPGATCAVSVTCSPTVVGPVTGNLDVVLTRNNASTQTATIALACEGVAAGTPILTALPNPLDFGSVLVGNTAGPSTVTVTVTNAAADIGTATIAGTNAGDFSISSDGCSGTTVPADGTCNIDLTFTPAAIGFRTATLTIPCLDVVAVCPDETVTLVGSGAAAPAGVTAVPAIGLLGLGGLSFLLAGSGFVALRRRRNK